MINTPPPRNKKIVLFQPNKLDAFFQNQRKKILRICIKLLSKRGKYPNFWIMFNDDICRQMLLNGFYERELLEGMKCLAKNKGGIAIDVGANIGNHTVYFSQYFSQVISFEPVPENCGVIRANLYLNRIKNVTLIEKGLGAEAAIIDLGNDDPTNTNNGFALSKIEQTIHSPGKRQATVVRGDDELQGIEFVNGISMIKIDVEGMEPQVIKGLTKTIQKYRPIVFWEAFTHDTASASVEMLREMGYENFYHITTRRSSSDLANKLYNAFGKSAYLVSLEECEKLDGMNVAMMNPAL